MGDFHDLPHIDVTYGDLGLMGQNPVLPVPDEVAREFVSRVGVQISWAAIAFDQFADALEAGAEEPSRHDEATVYEFRPGRRPQGAVEFRRKLMTAYSGSAR